MPANTSMMPIAVSAARTRVRRIAVAKLSSTALRYRSLCSSSNVNACTVWMAFNVSPASPLVSAMRSCDARDNPRTRLPITMRGTTTTGINTRMTPISFALVSPSMISPPIKLKDDRRMIDRLTPEMACTRVVSVVKRDNTSPTRVVSPNASPRPRVRPAKSPDRSAARQTRRI